MINISFESSWKNLPWRKFREKLYLIQTQIFHLIKNKSFKKALLQQQLLLVSSEFYYVAIKQITQLRLDRKIPGIDNQLINCSFQRINLLFRIKEKLHFWKSKQIKQVYLIDFVKGKTLVFIHNVSDRVIQYIWGLVLEPVFNSLFFENQMSLSSLTRCLFVKYSVILRLLMAMKCITSNCIHLKVAFSLDILSKLNQSYFLKILFFPDIYKKVMLHSFNPKIFTIAEFSSETLQFYLHSFQYFVLSFGFWSLNHSFLKKLCVSSFTLLSQPISIFYYFKEVIYIFQKTHSKDSYSTLFSGLISRNGVLSKILVIKNTYLNLGIDFLGWHFTSTTNYKCIVSPNKEMWLEHKTQFKKILKLNNYNIHQRVKLLEILIQTRFCNNWFCSAKTFKKESRILKSYLLRSLNKCPKLLRYQKTYILRQVFNSLVFI